jgi:hypothetical protein
MRCWRCGGRTEAQRVRFCVSDLSPPVLIANLPAEVCVQCGERTYSTKALTALTRVRDGKAPAPKLGHLYVYDYDEIDGSAQRSSGDFITVSPSLAVSGGAGIGISPIIKRSVGWTG